MEKQSHKKENGGGAEGLGGEGDGHLQAGQEALQDRWAQMLLGYPGTAWGEAGPSVPPSHRTVPPYLSMDSILPRPSEPCPTPTVSPFCPGAP